MLIIFALFTSNRYEKAYKWDRNDAISNTILYTFLVLRFVRITIIVWLGVNGTLYGGVKTKCITYVVLAMSLVGIPVLIYSLFYQGHNYDKINPK